MGSRLAASELLYQPLRQPTALVCLIRGDEPSTKEVGELDGVRAVLDQEEIRSSLLSVVSESLHDGIHERALPVCTDSVEYYKDLLRDLANSSVAHDPLDEAPQGFARQYPLQELRKRVRVCLRAVINRSHLGRSRSPRSRGNSRMRRPLSKTFAV